MQEALPAEAILHIKYENWLDEDKRLGILGEVVDFIGTC